MSQQPINLSPDLRKLQDDGYEIAIKCGHLVLFDVPYVNAQKLVKRGAVVSTLELVNDVTVKPSDHKVMFTGEHPCDRNGREMGNLKHGNSRQEICEGLIIERSFSCKPKEGYQDYYHKMTTYAEMISIQAKSIEPGATARTYAVIESGDPDEVFKYIDTASSRAGINVATKKLELSKIGIIGLGGTGSYILDMVAKTPVQEIHVFDKDDFLQHNAFRSPGAATPEELKAHLKKVAYFAARYSTMRNGIIAHDAHLDETNLTLLDGMDFVFICIDSGKPKPPIIQRLEADGIPFIDVGMGIELVDDKLLGILRTTASTQEMRDHFKKRVPLSDGSANDVYTKNIQVAELNALNASMAVIKWKKIFGFYVDLENEHSSNYTLDGNIISNIDKT
ncbi:MAG: ThiF family adenylyltransferase [Rhodospirillales bacterium]|jgi:tRNA A37 threonylcarbamoyladenosine dehydratase|nr:ThiF family adenylyltransferase [Rhodospirillales bacterium]MBT8002922.1 ThiF family adenylyltransferase [Rhodospirillales bacterium]